MGVLIWEILDTLGRMREADWSKVLGWPGYRVYRHEIDEPAKRLKLWVRRKRGNRKLICSGCGSWAMPMTATSARCQIYLVSSFGRRWWWSYIGGAVRTCRVKTEKVPQLPSKAPFSKRFEEAVGLACESRKDRGEPAEWSCGQPCGRWDSAGCERWWSETAARPRCLRNACGRWIHRLKRCGAESGAGLVRRPEETRRVIPEIRGPNPRRSSPSTKR